MIPAGDKVDVFAEGLERVRRELERKPSFWPSGRRREDEQKGSQHMLYLRKDVQEWLEEKVQLGEYRSMSQAANVAIRFCMQHEGK